MKVAPDGIISPRPDQRTVDYFRPGHPVWVWWKGKWRKAVVTIDTPDGARDIYVRCEENLGTKGYDGYGLIVGPRSDEIWPRISQEESVEGYVIESDGHFLTTGVGLHWFAHAKPQDAYVHPESILKKLQKEAQDWTKKPKLVYPARYENGKVTITGKPFPFEF